MFSLDNSNYDEESFEDYFSSSSDDEKKENADEIINFYGDMDMDMQVLPSNKNGKGESVSVLRRANESHRLDTVAFVAFHRAPASLYQQYQKRLYPPTSSPPLFPFVKESSSGSTSIYSRVSESTQTTINTSNDSVITLADKEVQCVNGFDDTYFENTLKLCREEKYEELLLATDTSIENSFTQSNKATRSQTPNNNVTRLSRFLRATSTIVERLLVEETQRAVIRKNNCWPNYKQTSKTHMTKQFELLVNGYRSFIEQQDLFLSCLPSYSQVEQLKHFLENKTITQVVPWVNDTKSNQPTCFVTIHIPSSSSSSCQGNNINGIMTSLSTDETLHPDNRTSSSAQRNKNLQFLYGMTTICLWDNNTISTSESLTPCDGDLVPSQLLLGEGIVSCTILVLCPNTKSSSSSIIIASGTEEGSLILWDTSSNTNATATDAKGAPHMERIKQLLQLGDNSINARMPSFHSDVKAQDQTCSIHHFGKITNLAAIPHDGDGLAWSSSSYFLDCALLASIDEHGLVILWRIYKEKGEEMLLHCTPLRRIGIENGEIVALSDAKSYMNSVLAASAYFPSAPASSSSMTAVFGMCNQQAIEWLPRSAISSSCSSTQLLFSTELNTIRRLDIKLENPIKSPSVITIISTTAYPNKYIRRLSGNKAPRIDGHVDAGTTPPITKTVFATIIVASPFVPELFISQWSDGSIALFQTRCAIPMMEWQHDNMVLLRDLLNHPITDLSAKTNISKRCFLRLLLSKISQICD